MSEIEKKLQTAVKKLLGDKRIDIFIGYGKTTVAEKTSPIFVKQKDDADKLVWNEFCVNNLATYLPRFFVIEPRYKEHKFPRIGIAAKGCDGRAIVGLIKENQMPRENLYIVGIVCEGMMDPVRNFASSGRKEGISNGVDSKNGKTNKRESCQECLYPTPLVYDELIGDEKKVEKEKLSRFKRIEEFRKKPLQERWRYFLKEMQKCIRCYACRQACPTCYCKECFTEETQPKWHGVSSDISDVIYYQLGRLFHQAGRCVDCGSCSWVCPMGIDLRLFLQGLLKDVKDLYGYEAGLSIDELPPLAVFKMDDAQKFITEP